MKKLFSIVLTVLIFIPVTVNAGMMDSLIQNLNDTGIQSFPDVSSDHHNYMAVEWMTSEGTLEGYPDGTFAPDGAVNRAELMKMVVLSVAEEGVADTYANCFPDVKDEWFAKYVCYAGEQEWIDGYPDGNFRPGNNVNRAEALKIILNALISSDEWPDPTDAELALDMPVDLDMDAWYGGYARFALVKELVDDWHQTENADGTLNYYPDGEFTRKEVAEMLFRITVFMAEREDYAFNMAESACYYVENNGTMTEEEMRTGAIQLFEDNGSSEAEMDLLTLKYGEDNVVLQKIAEMVDGLCGK